MNKKTFFSLFLCLIFFSANSQITKGNWLVGGSGNLYSYKGDYMAYNPPDYRTESKYTEINLSLNGGYFLVDKAALGLRATMSSIKGDVVNGGSTNVQEYMLGPFARYYFLEVGRPFNILADVGYQYGFYGGIATGEGNFNKFTALAGPVLYFNTVVGFEFLLGYVYDKRDVKDISTVTRKGFQVALGFQIHLEQD